MKTSADLQKETHFREEEICLGIDEAGRGPVLGPMVYASCFWAVSDEECIKKHFKFDDSKKLKDVVREKIFEEMQGFKNILNFDAIVLSPEELSNDMQLRNKKSLNLISTDAACKLIANALEAGVNLRYVYVDTVGSAAKYEELLKNRFIHKKIEFKVTPKADSLFPVVSAASIVAKVTRDRAVLNWEYKENIFDPPKYLFDNNFGSGYPSDPNCVNWLSKNFEPVFVYPSITRFSWKTVSNLIKDKGGYAVKWENYEDDDGKTRSVFKDVEENEKIDFFVKDEKEYNYLKENNLMLTGFKF